MSTTQRVVRKQLAGAEDLLQGIGTVTQTRGTGTYPIHKLDIPIPTYDIAEMQASSAEFMRLYGSDTAYTDYRRNPEGTIGIPSNLGGVWEPMRSSEYLVCGNFATGAYVFSSDCVVGYNNSFTQWRGSLPKVVAAGSTPATSGGISSTAWVDRTDLTFRSELADEESSVSISGKQAKNIAKISYSLYDAGAIGDGVADDTAAILNAIAFVKANQEYRLIQNGGAFKYSTTLPFNDCESVFSSLNEPIEFHFNCELVYAGIDKAVNLTGNGWGYSVCIETLTGSGVIAEGAEGSSAENIGLYIGPNSGCKVKVGTITNFNINTLFDGAYFNTVDVDYSFRCLYSVKMRVHPTVGYFPNANRYYGTLCGGPYVAGGATSDNNAKYGLHITGGQSNIIDVGGIEYAARTTDSVNIYLDPTSQNNQITCHTEGSTYRNVIDYGQGNILNIDGCNSQLITNTNVYLGGVGGKFGPIHKQQIANQITSFAPHQGQGEIRINPSCEVLGTVMIRELPASSAIVHNIANGSPDPSVFVRSDATNTSVTSGTNYPAAVNATPNELTYTIVTATDNTVWFTVGPYSLNSATHDDMMFSCMMRGAVNTLKASIFILDQSGVFMDSINTELRAPTAWLEIKFPFKRGAATSLYYRIALRGFDGLNGGTIEFFRPKITFDVASELHHSAALGLPNKQTIKGNLLGEPVSKMFADINRIETQQIVSTAFPVYGRELIIFSNTAGGDTINAFTKVIEGQQFTVLNISGAALNISLSAMSIGAGLTIQNGYSMRFIKYAGNIYPVRT